MKNLGFKLRKNGWDIFKECNKKPFGSSKSTHQTHYQTHY